MSQTELARLIEFAGRMDYDTLRDVYDRVYYDYAKERQRMSKQSGDKAEAEQWRLRAARCKARRRGLTAFAQVTIPKELEPAEDLPLFAKEVFCAAIEGFINAKKPKAGQRDGIDGLVAKGYWQVKTKKTKVTIKDENGEPKIDEDGKVMKVEMLLHYLYLRVYNANLEDLKRVASIYCGSLNRSEPAPFIEAISNDEITKEMIVKEFVERGYDGVKQWRQGMDDLNEFGVPIYYDDGVDAPLWAQVFFFGRRL
jgi:hypothetical protein